MSLGLPSETFNRAYCQFVRAQSHRRQTPAIRKRQDVAMTGNGLKDRGIPFLKGADNFEEWDDAIISYLRSDGL
jgi:hypothetical protein